MSSCCSGRLRLLIISNSSGKNLGPTCSPTRTKSRTTMSTSQPTSKEKPSPVTAYSISPAAETSKSRKFRSSLKGSAKTRSIWRPQKSSKRSLKRLILTKLRIWRMRSQLSSLCQMTRICKRTQSMTMWLLWESS